MLRAAFTGTFSRIAVRSALPVTRPMTMGNELVLIINLKGFVFAINELYFTK